MWDAGPFRPPLPLHPGTCLQFREVTTTFADKVAVIPFHFMTCLILRSHTRVVHEVQGIYRRSTAAYSDIPYTHPRKQQATRNFDSIYCT